MPGSPHPEFEHVQYPYRSSRPSGPVAAFLWASAAATHRREIDAAHPSTGRPRSGQAPGLEPNPPRGIRARYMASAAIGHSSDQTPDKT